MKASNSVEPARREIKLNDKDAARFWPKADKNGPTMPHMTTPCWVWTASKNGKGYGLFKISGRYYKAHRVAFLLSGSTFPEGKPNSLHRCDNPSCVNPDHLFAGDNSDNMQDRDEKGRVAHGESHCCAKLSDADCAFIRASPLSHKVIATQFSVSPNYIHTIRRGASRSRP